MSKIMEIKNDAAFEMVSLPEVNRYWFRRGVCDIRYGRDRQVVVAIEKAGWSNNGIEKSLPWNVSLEDRNSAQFWKLILFDIDGEERIVFERFARGKTGGKSSILGLGFLPGWVIEELRQVAIEMKQRGLDKDGAEFLGDLVNKIEQEKKETRAKLKATVEETKISGLFHIMSPTHGDSRGSFREVVRFPEIELLTGYDFVGKQVNHSVSVYGTLRGMHVEPWAKLVTVVSGLAVCIFLDCRPKSKTFGKTEKIYLGFGTTPDGEEVKGGAVFIETGIANSFMVLSDKMEYMYTVDDLWRPDTATYSINPMDEKLAIPWSSFVPMGRIIRSERDINSPSFEEFVKAGK